MKAYRWMWHNKFGFVAIVVVLIATNWSVRKFHTPGHLDVIEAQAMDMSRMRPPAGAAPVALVPIRTGSLNNSVTYTGSVLAYNEQDISPRITGTVLAIPVYPGDVVHAGQLVAQLDSAEVSANARQADNQARAAEFNAEVAHLTHHVHHGAALELARAQLEAAQDSVSDAQAEAKADDAAIADASAAVRSSQAQASYWQTEIDRERKLADAGAASQQEYQNEAAQAQSAFAAVDQAQAKARQAVETDKAGQAKVRLADHQLEAAQSGVGMAQADIAVAERQVDQAGADASAAEDAAQAASDVQGYTHIVSPVDGVVVARPLAPGTLVQPGAVILRIAEIDRVRVQANVAVEDFDGIQVGNPVEIDMSQGAQTVNAKVTAIFPSADQETRTAVVEAVIPNPGHRILPGAFVSMRIAKSAEGLAGLLAPSSSIVSVGGLNYLWVAQTAGRGGLRYRAVCGYTYSAADAKKYHYICPMDHKKLVPIVNDEADTASDGPVTAHEVEVQVGASDGAWSEVASDDLYPSDCIVLHGQAGLVEGAHIVVTAWGPDGPISLPDAASADAGLTMYRCEVCGMTYSEADARKDQFVDPMDGGKLVPVTVSANPGAGI